MASGCAAAGVEQGEFVGVELVLADEAPGLDPPQALADAEVRQELLLGACQAEGGSGLPEMVELLPVHDPRLGVREQ